MENKWPIQGAYIIHSDEKELVSSVTKAVFGYAAKHGRGNRLKERYENLLTGRETDYAPAGAFALVGGVLVGGITYQLHNDWVFLHCGYVWEQYRGLGIYSALMKTIEGAAKEQGLSGIFVSTYDFEAPIVYEHMGFTKGAILTNCPAGNTSTDYYKNFCPLP